MQGCGEDAHVDRQLSARAEAEDSPLFDHAEQFGLHLRPHLCELIEQEGSTVRSLEASHRWRSAPVKAPRS
jgi:hypothetical protein